MKRLIAVLVLAAVAGCKGDRPAQTERWFVVQRAYVPSTHGSGWSYGKGGGYVSVTTEEQWTVVLSTPRGVETVNDKAMWAGAREGRCALVSRIYNEVVGQSRTAGWYWEPDSTRKAAR